MPSEKPRVGDTVKTGLVRTGRVQKVKPDGTRIVRTKLGTLRKQRNPEKPIERPRQ